jgi:hypothetical protein
VTTDWKGLDKQVRKTLLGGGRAPDEHTARIAVHEARARLGRGWSRFAPALAAGAVAGLVTVALKIADAGAFMAVPVAAVVVAVAWREIRGMIVWSRILDRHAAAAPLPSPAPGADPAASGPGTVAVRPGPDGTADGEIAYDLAPGQMARIAVLMTAGALLCAVAAVYGDAVYGTFSYGTVLRLSLVILAVVCALGTLMPILIIASYKLWRRPYLAIGPDGVRSPLHGRTVPWQEITEVRIMPYRGAHGKLADHKVITFRMADPDTYLASLSGPMRQAGKGDLNAYGTPLAFTDALLHGTVQEVAAAVPRFTSVPVTETPA